MRSYEKMPIKFTWKGSALPDVKLGKATYTFDYDDQALELELDFITAQSINTLLVSVYEGGKLQGASYIQSVVSNAMRNVIGE
jgi:hypothetical protein